MGGRLGNGIGQFGDHWTEPSTLPAFEFSHVTFLTVLGLVDRSPLAPGPARGQTGRLG